MNITLYDYTALKNPSGARQVVAEYNMRPAQHPRQLAKQLAMCVNRFGNDALDKIVDVHPDVPLFQRKFDSIKDQYKKEAMSNFMDYSGQSIKREVERINGNSDNSKEPSDKSKDMLVMGGIIILGLALILRK